MCRPATKTLYSAAHFLPGPEKPLLMNYILTICIFAVMIVFYLVEVSRWNKMVDRQMEAHQRQCNDLYEMIKRQWYVLNFHTGLLNNLQPPQKNKDLN